MVGKLVSASALLALLCAASVAAESDASPEFCHGLDCPSYKVLDKADTWELREYKKASWVSTVVEGYVYETSISTGFKRLYDYISGENEQHRVINMTAPVRTKVVPGDGPFCKSNFTISFFTPFEFQLDDAPVPASPDVFVEVTPTTRVYVSEFGGFAITPVITSKLKALTDELHQAGAEIVEDYYFIAGYDSPFRLKNRHNEVWVVVDGTSSSSGSSMEAATDASEQ